MLIVVGVDGVARHVHDPLRNPRVLPQAILAFIGKEIDDPREVARVVALTHLVEGGLSIEKQLFHILHDTLQPLFPGARGHLEDV